jgi:ATPase subunit of ABC transporter with duplicated ATPase domains
MITVNNLSLQFGGDTLFSRVDLQFVAGNCYGVIGANGSGKSTFLKILAGELDQSSGSVEIKPDVRMSVLKQDQSMYDEHIVIETVIMGNPRLFECVREKDAIYNKEDFSAADTSAGVSCRERFA